MAAKKDSNSVVGEVRLMKGAGDELVIDPNGLKLPEGEICVYKDSSGELVLVVHTDEPQTSEGPPDSFREKNGLDIQATDGVMQDSEQGSKTTADFVPAPIDKSQRSIKSVDDAGLQASKVEGSEPRRFSTGRIGLQRHKSEEISDSVSEAAHEKMPIEAEKSCEDSSLNLPANTTGGNNSRPTCANAGHENAYKASSLSDCDREDKLKVQNDFDQNAVLPSGATALRRSGRERHAKKFEDYVEVNVGRVDGDSEARRLSASTTKTSSAENQLLESGVSPEKQPNRKRSTSGTNHEQNADISHHSLSLKENMISEFSEPKCGSEKKPEKWKAELLENTKSEILSSTARLKVELPQEERQKRKYGNCAYVDKLLCVDQKERHKKLGLSKLSTKTKKQYKMLVGETATLNRRYISLVASLPVQTIEQAPPRPSQAVIKRYCPLSSTVGSARLPASHCRIMYRLQDTFGVDMTEQRSHEYSCVKCNYSTCRINNYVRHLRDICAFNKDFFSWDDATLNEVTGQKICCSKKEEKTSLFSELKLSKTSSKVMPVSQLRKSSEAAKDSSTSSIDCENAAREGTGAANKNSAVVERPVYVAQTLAFLTRKETKTREPVLHGGHDDETASARLGYRRHDIVWADLGKGVYWPALVLGVINRGLQGKARKNTMQVKVYFVHDGSRRTLPTSKVDGFDSEHRQRYLEFGRGGRGSLGVEHAKAAQKADKYLRERVLGSDIDPIQYFCLGEAGVIERSRRSSSILVTSSSSDDEDLDAAIVHEGTDDGANLAASSKLRWSLPDAIASLTSAIEVNGLTKTMELLKKAKRFRKTRNALLVDFIVQGKVELHLVGVYRGTVPSERHASFMSQDKARQSALKQSSWWGPVDDPGQQEAIYEYCHDLLERTASDTPIGTEHPSETEHITPSLIPLPSLKQNVSTSTAARRSSSAPLLPAKRLRKDESTENVLLSHSEETAELDKCTYAFEVFCPEAIIKAISRLALVDLEEAASIFLQGSEQSQQFVEGQKIFDRDRAHKIREDAECRERFQQKQLHRFSGSATEICAGQLECDSRTVRTDDTDRGNDVLTSRDLVREELKRLGVAGELLDELEVHK